MYTEPIIVNADRLKCRGYVTFQLDGIRQRVASGRTLGLPIYPNRAKTLKLRREGMEWLRAEIVKCLAEGSFPMKPESAHDADVRLIVNELHQLTREIKRANELHEVRLARLEAIHIQLADYLALSSRGAAVG